MQHALRLMLEHGRLGTIVNVTSDAAVEAYPTWGGYGASKAALEHVSRVLAAELEGSAREKAEFAATLDHPDHSVFLFPFAIAAILAPYCLASDVGLINFYDAT